MNDRLTYRPAETADAPFLRQMLERAFDWRQDPTFDRNVLAEPHVTHYVTPWRTGADLGVVAEHDGVPVGAAWVRHLTSTDPGYGYVRDGIPELSLAVTPGFQGRGIGRGLLERLLRAVADAGIEGISLSVEDGNGARWLYETLGFRVVGREGNSDTMLVEFQAGGVLGCWSSSGEPSTP